ncbi:MAG: DUF445 family protein [Gemmatimonadota bacterium]|nr:DUF445 family protein [Gemmatimonadota bacterium]MDH5803592.1 DUF445 family protein [Gemmatimonadota bacterium]
MSSEFSLLRAAVTIAFGAVAGGITNAVAIWMLFHPYTPRGLWRLKLQGAIPKNKTRLAKTIGRTVGQRLLTPDDLAEQLSAPGIKDAFENAVRQFAGEFLKVERGSLQDELPPQIMSEIESALQELAPKVSEKLGEYAASEEFEKAVAKYLTQVSENISEQPLSDFLTPDRKEAIRERVSAWAGNLAHNPDLEKVIGQWIDRHFVTLSKDPTPLLDRLPAPLISAVEHEIAGYLPLALERLNETLRDPKARANIQRSLHSLFEKFVKSLLVHERVVARLVVTEKTFERLLGSFEKDGADQVSRLLEEPAMRDQVAKSVNDAVVKFLRKPLAEHFESLGAERLEGIKGTVVHHISEAIRDPGTQAYVLERVDHAMESAEKKTAGEFFRYVPPERVASWTRDAVTSPKVKEWVDDAVQGAFRAFLTRPIGIPEKRLPPGSTDRLTNALVPVLWSWIQEQIPKIVSQVDVAGMVEEKVAGFSLPRIEEIVRATTQRELDVIVRLGYLLGAVVGTAAYLTSMFLP